jgi:DNA-binding CsgD family transcriptional regulator
MKQAKSATDRNLLVNLSKVVGREILRLRIYEEPPGFLCERDLVQKDGSVHTQVLPFTSRSTLMELLAADPYYAALRKEADHVLQQLFAEVDHKARGATPELAIHSLDAVHREIASLKDCLSETEVAAVMGPLIRYFGLESYVFVSLRRGDVSRESYRYFIGCLPAWCEIYNARKWYIIDPCIQHALRESSPILGSSMMPPESPGQAELLATAREYGFRSGMLIPAHSGSDFRVGALYLGSNKEPKDIEPRLLKNRVLLRAIAMELHEWWQAKLMVEALTGLRFDQLDLELLKMAYEGLTTEDAARNLELSRSQVNNRFRKINQKLNVTSKKRAVQAALELGVLRI